MAATPAGRLTGIPGGLMLQDGLRNAITGAGTGADKNTFRSWSAGCSFLDPSQIEAAYRTNWLVRKVHDLPPFDETRAWRDWQAEDDQIQKLEAEERRLEIRGKVQRARLLARLWGGGALLLGLPGDASQPAPSNDIGKGKLAYVHVVSRNQLAYDQIDRDLLSPTFGQPRMWRLPSAKAGQADIHPSRVIAFIGQRSPEGSMGGGMAYRTSSITAGFAHDEFWGDPLLLSIDEAMKDCIGANSGVAALIQEAKVDTVKFKGLSELISTSAGEQVLMNRLATNTLAKSMHNANVLDAEDEWDTRELSFAGLKDLMEAFAGFAAAATDIPQTRLLGRSPAGLSATGESDSLNYETMIGAKQEVELRPCLDRLDTFLIPSALGSRPPEVYYEFAPLRQMTEKERAEIFKTKMEGVTAVLNTGALPDSALAKGITNLLVEDAIFPGLEAALADAESAGDIPNLLEEPEEVDEDLIPGDPEPDELDQPPARRAANDALTPEERRGVIDRLWSYLVGEPEKGK